MERKEDSPFPEFSTPGIIPIPIPTPTLTRKPRRRPSHIPKPALVRRERSMIPHVDEDTTQISHPDNLSPSLDDF